MKTCLSFCSRLQWKTQAARMAIAKTSITITSRATTLLNVKIIHF